jgi:hypothetical protein
VGVSVSLIGIVKSFKGQTETGDQTQKVVVTKSSSHNLGNQIIENLISARKDCGSGFSVLIH